MTVYDPKILFCEKCGVVFVSPKEYEQNAKTPFPWRKTLQTICAVIIPIIAVKVAVITIDFSIFKNRIKQNEARSILEEIYFEETSYCAMKATFSTDLNEIGFKTFSEPEYYEFKIIQADKYGFVARAWGNIDEDDKIDIWEVTDKSRTPVCIYDDVKNEGKEIDPLKP